MTKPMNDKGFEDSFDGEIPVLEASPGVSYEKPRNKSILVATQSLVRADLHNHLNTSGKFKDKYFNAVIDRASENLGCDGILGVVDFEDNRYEKFSKLKGYERVFFEDERRAFLVPEKDILVVHGQEVPTLQGHLLVLASGMNTKIKSGRSIEDTIQEAKDNDATLVMDHPFYVDGLMPYVKSHPEVLRELDAMEVHNGEAEFSPPFLNRFFPRRANEKAQMFYELVQRDFPNLGALASSDGHSIYEIGSSWTEIKKPNLNSFVEDFRTAVRSAGTDDDKRGHSIIGAIDHILDLATIIGISKLTGSKA